MFLACVIFCLLFTFGFSTTAEDLGLNIDSFLYTKQTVHFRPEQSSADYDINAGGMVTVQLTINMQNTISDHITVEMSSYHNGYSPLVLCQAPKITGSHDPPSVANFRLDSEVEPSDDLLVLDYGDSNWNSGETSVIELSVVYAHHPMVKTDTILWFAAVVSYNNGDNAFVIDIAFRSAYSDYSQVISSDFTLSSLKNQQIRYGGAGYTQVQIINPFPSVNLKLLVNITGVSDMCICTLNINSVANIYTTCGAEGIDYNVELKPQFNNTCSKEGIVNMGVVTKSGSSAPTSNDFIIVDVTFCSKRTNKVNQTQVPGTPSVEGFKDKYTIQVSDINGEFAVTSENDLYSIDYSPEINDQGKLIITSKESKIYEIDNAEYNSVAFVTLINTSASATSDARKMPFNIEIELKFTTNDIFEEFVPHMFINDIYSMCWSKRMTVNKTDDGVIAIFEDANQLSNTERMMGFGISSRILSKSINENIDFSAKLIYRDGGSEDLETTSYSIEFINQTHCDFDRTLPELSFIHAFTLEEGYALVPKGSFERIDLEFFYAEEHSLFHDDFTIFFHLENIEKRYFSIYRAYPSHVGNNFNDFTQRVNEVKYKYQIASTDFENPVTMYNESVEMDLDFVTYFAIDDRNILNRMLRISVDIYLQPNEYLDFDYQQKLFYTVHMGCGVHNTGYIILKADPISLTSRKSDPSSASIQSILSSTADSVDYISVVAQNMEIELKIHIPMPQLQMQRNLVYGWETFVTTTPASYQYCSQEVYFGKNIANMNRFTGYSTSNIPQYQAIISNLAGYGNESDSDNEIVVRFFLKAVSVGYSTIAVQSIAGLAHKSETIATTTLFEKRLDISNTGESWIPDIENLGDVKVELVHNTSMDNPLIRAGGAYLATIDLYIPPKTALPVVWEIFTKESILQIKSVTVLDVGYNIGKCFNRSQIIAQEVTRFTDAPYYDMLTTVDMGYMTNLEKDASQEIKNFTNMVKLQIYMLLSDDFTEDHNYTVKFLTHDYVFEVPLTENYDFDSEQMIYPEMWFNMELPSGDAKVEPTKYYELPIKVYLPEGYNYHSELYILGHNVAGEQAFVIRNVSIKHSTFDLHVQENLIKQYESVDRIGVEYNQEGSANVDLGIITSTGYYHRLGQASTETNSELTIIITIQIMDVANEDPIDIVAAFSGEDRVVHNAKYSLKPIFNNDRRPVLTTDYVSDANIESLLLPGGNVSITGYVQHACSSKAKALTIKLCLFIPKYVNYKYMDDEVYNRIVATESDYALNDHNTCFEFNELLISERLSYNIMLNVYESHEYLRDPRVYHVAIPIEVTYLRQTQTSDTDDSTKVYNPKIEDLRFYFTVMMSSCTLPITNCSYIADAYQDGFPPKSADGFIDIRSEVQGFKSSNWKGQYLDSKSISVTCLDKYMRVTQIALKTTTSIEIFRIQYSKDPAGIYWNDYMEDDEIHFFVVNDSYPYPNDPEYDFVNLMNPISAIWLKLVFVQTSWNSDDVAYVRMKLYGCTTDYPGIARRQFSNDTILPEIYLRGFVTDENKRKLYVCEKNTKKNIHECQKLEIREGVYIWQALDAKPHSIIGVYRKPLTENQIIAVGSSLANYISSDDDGYNWNTMPIYEFFSISKSSYYKSAKIMPEYMTSTTVQDTDPELDDVFDELNIFRGNYQGIHHSKDGGYTWKLIYSWISCCSE